MHVCEPRPTHNRPVAGSSPAWPTMLSVTYDV